MHSAGAGVMDGAFSKLACLFPRSSIRISGSHRQDLYFNRGESNSTVAKYGLLQGAALCGDFEGYIEYT